MENETRQDMKTTKGRKERIFPISHSNEETKSSFVFLPKTFPTRMTVIFSDLRCESIPIEFHIHVTYDGEQSGSAKKGREICLENRQEWLEFPSFIPSLLTVNSI